ncbi:MAG TPA: glycosyltransferase family 39 protein [Phycisphaerae bacterium]|nr:glycosyltransferase family 39 protein [Phycisphaerae bacterium]
MPQSTPFRRPIRLYVILVLTVYAAGLMHGLSRPWTGMHDWNGAFYSQLARNFLRYPAAVHHGMGVIAVGQTTPPPEERSLYANHPPALVWLVAGAFSAAGESEAIARALPILASLLSLWLFMVLIRPTWGSEAAWLAGLIYALMPMSVYFGRMVNHEPLCLCLMLASAVALRGALQPAVPASRRRKRLALWAGGIAFLVWTDWPGILFAGLTSLWAAWQWRRNRLGLGQFAFIFFVSAAATLSLICFLVYAGLDGRWSGLGDIFFNRRSSAPDLRNATALAHIAGNLTWPIAALVLVYLVSQGWSRMVSRRTGRYSPNEEPMGGCEAMGLVTITGLIWVLLFWRLFKIHNYWMFYLGPWIALSAARTLLDLRAALSRYAGASAQSILYGVLAVVAVTELIGADRYFARTFVDNATIAAWREIQRRTQPSDRVMLSWSPVTHESAGNWALRTIDPPQLAYYMDRAFDVTTDPRFVMESARTHPLYVIPQVTILKDPAKFESLRRFNAAPAGDLLLIEVRQGAAATPPDKPSEM